jgi:hypothetical protein
MEGGISRTATSALFVQVPQLQVGLQDQMPTPLREVVKGDLGPEVLVGRPSAVQRAAASGPERIVTHGQVGIFAGLFERE